MKLSNEMDQVVVTSEMVNIYTMQVCAAADATDEEILDACNLKNLCGTSHGWTTVVRNDDEMPQRNPVRCASHPERVHYLVTC